MARLIESYKFPFDEEAILSKEPDDRVTYFKSLIKALRKVYDMIASTVNLNQYMIVRTATAADLSGAAETLIVLHAERDCVLEKATLLYTEASSADAGITVEIGKESDRDYYYTGATEQSKAQWYSKDVDLLKQDIAAGDTVTFYSAGGKAGTGKIMCVIEYTLKQDL